MKLKKTYQAFFDTPSGQWSYYTAAEVSAKALVAPSGHAYLLPSGISVTYVMDSKHLLLCCSLKIGSDRKNKRPPFNTEDELLKILKLYYSPEYLAGMGIKRINKCIPYRKQNLNYQIVVEDVLVPVDRLITPFPSFGDVVSYLRINHSARVLPQWAKSETDIHLRKRHKSHVSNLVKKGFYQGVVSSAVHLIGNGLAHHAQELLSMTGITRKIAIDADASELELKTVDLANAWSKR